MVFPYTAGIWESRNIEFEYELDLELDFWVDYLQIVMIIMKYNKLKRYLSGFLNIKPELAEKSTHSITWQLTNNKKSFKGRLKAFIWRRAVS